MKEGWEYIDFKDVFPIKMGKTPPRGDKSSWDEKKETHNKWVSIADISNNEGKIIEDTKEYISDSAAEKISKVSKGSLLMSFKLSIGRMAFAGDDLYTNEAIIAIPENDKYILRFIYYYLLSYDWLSLTEGNEKVKGATLNKTSIGKIQLPVLSIIEQQSIVDYLDSAFAKIDAMKANAEKALNEAKALFQASLKEMLEPKEGKLDDIGELKNGMNFNKNESGYNIHILGVGDFGNLFQIEDTDYLQRIALNSNPSEEYILKNEDIVFVRSNGNKNLVGRCVLIHVGDEPCFFSGFCIRFRKSTNEVDACYLTYFLKTEESRRKLVGNGANISNLNQKVLNEFVVSYPSLSVQQSIVATLDSLKSKVDRLQENYDKISQECDALKQALLRKVFE